MTGAERAVLEAVARQDVTWRRRDGVHGPTRTSYRRWTSEDDYVLVTKPAARLVADGFVIQVMAAGYSFIGRGFLELTEKGRAVLKEDGNGRPVRP